MAFHAPAHYAVEHPIFGKGVGNNGFFKFERNNVIFFCVASDGAGWEHVSVSLNVRRCPTWDEMCMVKNLFWGEDDCVLQFHPRKKDYVNRHPYCLHLWRPVGMEVPTPERWLVG